MPNPSLKAGNRPPDYQCCVKQSYNQALLHSMLQVFEVKESDKRRNATNKRNNLNTRHGTSLLQSDQHNLTKTAGQEKKASGKFETH